MRLLQLLPMRLSGLLLMRLSGVAGAVGAVAHAAVDLVQGFHSKAAGEMLSCMDEWLGHYVFVV